MRIADTILGETIRTKRRQYSIPLAVVAIKAGINANRLSSIERGHITTTGHEMRRLIAAVDELILAKQESQKVALRFGWPAEVEVSPS